MGAAAPPSPVRRDARRAAQRVAGHLDRRGRIPPRELGRQGLSAGHRRRGDPTRRTDRGDRRRLRRDHLGAVVQGAREPNRSPRRARTLRRDAVRPPPRARLREHLARQDAARDGPALVALTRAAARPPAADAVHRRVARRGRGHREHGRGRYCGPQDTAQAASLRTASSDRRSQRSRARPAPRAAGTPPGNGEADPHEASRAVRRQPAGTGGNTRRTCAPTRRRRRPLPPAAEPEAEQPTVPLRAGTTPENPPAPTPKPPATPGTPPPARRRRTASASAGCPARPGSSHPERCAELQRGGQARPRSRTTALSSIAGWATAISPGPASEASQNVTFTVTADTPALFAVQPAISPSGQLTFTSAANASGLATVTVTAHDDGGTANGGTNTSAPSSFTITVLPVNDAPTFTAGANQTVLEDTGAQSVAGWATAISPGPANESSQSRQLHRQRRHPGALRRPARSRADGTLTYTPAPNANGLATDHRHGRRQRRHRQRRNVDTSAPQHLHHHDHRRQRRPELHRRSEPDRRAKTTAPRSIAGWATAITPGPANESSQTVSFTSPAPTTRHCSPSNRPSQPTEHSPTPPPRTPTASPRSPSPPSTTAAPPTAARTPAPPAPSPSPSTPVNDAPSFTAGSNQSVVSLLGAQTIPGWATGITAGPADESSQNVTFIVSSTNRGLFAVQPTIAPTERSLTPDPARARNRDRHRARETTTAAAPTGEATRARPRRSRSRSSSAL